MKDKELEIETLKELQIWLNGKFELIASGQEHTNAEIHTLRDRFHTLSNDVTKLLALDLEGKIKTIGEHDAELETLRQEATTVKTAYATAKTAYAIFGALVGGTAAIALELAKIIRP